MKRKPIATSAQPPVMTANIENIHEIYNIFCKKNSHERRHYQSFDHFHLSQRLRHLKMEKLQGVSASLLIVLLCLFRMCHESIGRFYSHQFYGLFQSGKNCFCMGHRSSRAREFHPHPLTEPCVKVFPHTAIEITIDKKTFFFITA